MGYWTVGTAISDFPVQRPVERIIAATLAIASQRLVSRIQERTSRAERRRTGDDRQVTTIVLRRTKEAQPNTEEKDVDWSCRWLVRPHWRQQWFPNSQEHHPKLILGYVKGPTGKPLRLTQRVFLGVR